MNIAGRCLIAIDLSIRKPLDSPIIDGRFVVSIAYRWVLSLGFGVWWMAEILTSLVNWPEIRRRMACFQRVVSDSSDH